MRALIANAEWAPRPGYPLSEGERKNRRALIGSQVWRNSCFEIKDVPTPDIDDDEVLIRVKFCGICGSDTHVYEMDDEGYTIFSGLLRLPCIIGHEFSGVVEKAGRKVTTLKIGDPVAVESIQWCGVCTPCRSGAPNQCKNIELTGLSADGAFADFIKSKERYCWELNSLKDNYGDDDLFKLGALVEPVGCAYNGMFISGDGVRPGDTFVVYGAGPIGLGAVALARITGASKIIAFDIKDKRLELARAMGADFVFNSNRLKDDGIRPHEKVLDITGGEGADISVEAAGAAPNTIPEMEKAMAPGGKIVYLGRAATSTPMFLDSLVSGANRIVGSRGHSGYKIFHNIIRLIAGKKLDIIPMVTACYPFSRIMDALKVSTERTDGKILVGL
ncbi:alcohol dehydrogenase catalytic domain-containing protein [bacterium]|nr:alcohol dehydrogenase catalytic domain-containing protein [bacterium]